MLESGRHGRFPRLVKDRRVTAREFVCDLRVGRGLLLDGLPGSVPPPPPSRFDSCIQTEALLITRNVRYGSQADINARAEKGLLSGVKRTEINGS